MKDFLTKIYIGIKNVFIRMLLVLKKHICLLFDKICVSFDKCLDGEESLNKMLWCWCIIPNVFFMSKYFLFLYQFNLTKILVILYTLLCFYFILKAVKMHPEYNVAEVRRREELEYIASLNEDELREYIKTKNSNKIKDLFKKALLQKAWHTKEFYKITQIFLLVVFLFTLLKLF